MSEEVIVEEKEKEEYEFEAKEELPMIEELEELYEEHYKPTVEEFTYTEAVHEGLVTSIIRAFAEVFSVKTLKSEVVIKGASVGFGKTLTSSTTVKGADVSKSSTLSAEFTIS